MFGHTGTILYFGKAGLRRARNKKITSGVVARFREHILNTYGHQRPAGHRTRYQMWNQYPLHMLFFVPLVYRPTVSILDYERVLIRTFQPPIQSHNTNTRRCKFRRPRKMRLHIKNRKHHHTPEHELDLNFFNHTVVTFRLQGKLRASRAAKRQGIGLERHNPSVPSTPKPIPHAKVRPLAPDRIP